jgi:hypothetical protein
MGIVLLIKAAAHNSKIKYKGKKKQSAKTKENVGFAISRKRDSRACGMRRAKKWQAYVPAASPAPQVRINRKQ